MLKCDKEVNSVGERIHQYLTLTKIKFKGYYAIEQNSQILLRLIKEIFRVIDIIKEEKTS